MPASSEQLLLCHRRSRIQPTLSLSLSLCAYLSALLLSACRLERPLFISDEVGGDAIRIVCPCVCV